MIAVYDYSETAQDFGLTLQDQGGIKENAVTLVIDPETYPEAREGTASVHLMDATTSLELARVEGVEMSISV